MTLFVLEWDNGLSYGDNQVTLLGVYGSGAARDGAKAHYDRLVQWPFSDRRHGRYAEYEIDLDAHLVQDRPRAVFPP